MAHIFGVISTHGALEGNLYLKCLGRQYESGVANIDDDISVGDQAADALLGFRLQD